MNTKVTREDLNFFEELRRQGIAIDGEVFRELNDASNWLCLRQSPIAIETTVFDLPDGTTGFILAIIICNESKQIIVPLEYRLAIPWLESQFRWLEKPWTKSPQEREYLFSSPRLAGFDPEDVLNHRLGSKGKLFPNSDREGFLLGVGQAPIPEEYLDRQSVCMSLSILDQRGDCHELKLKLIVSRDQQRRPQSDQSMCGVSAVFKGNRRRVADRRVVA